MSMDHRTGKQCRERYINHLDPDMKKTPWTIEEDDVIRDLFPEVGTKWSQYMESLPGRSDNAIKNRYHVISRSNFESRSRSDSCSMVSVPRKRSMSDITSATDGHDDSSDSHAHSQSDASQKRLIHLHRARQMLERKIQELEDHTTFLTGHASPSDISTNFGDAEIMSDLDSEFGDLRDMEQGFAFDWAEPEAASFLSTEVASAEVPIAPTPVPFPAPTDAELLNVPFDFSCYEVAA